MSEIMNRNWNILQINNEFHGVSPEDYMSQQIKRTFNIFHKLTCKNQYVMTSGIWSYFQETFWIIKLETLAPKKLNQELNNV